MDFNYNYRGGNRRGQGGRGRSGHGGRGGYSEGERGGGRGHPGRGRGSSDFPRQESSSYSPGRGSSSSSHYERGGGGHYRVSAQEPEESCRYPQEQSRGCFPRGQRGEYTRGAGPERSDRGWGGAGPERSDRGSGGVGTRIWGAPTAQFRTLTVESSGPIVSTTESPIEAKESWKTNEGTSGPSKKSHHQEEKGKQEASSTSEGTSVSEDVSKPSSSAQSKKSDRKKKTGKQEASSTSEGTSVSKDSSKPSTSAQASDAGDQSSVKKGAPGTDGNQQSVSSAYNEIPKRRTQGPIGVGSKYFERGTAKIEVNYLPIEFTSKNVTIYHYDVDFGNRMNKTATRALISEARRKWFPKRHPAFDGRKNLYAAKDPLFPGNSRTESIKVTVDGKEKECVVTLTRVAQNVELTIGTLYDYMTRNGCTMRAPRSSIQALEIALKGNLSDQFVSCGRAFYLQSTQNDVQLSPGLNLLSGFTQSSVLGTQKPYINIDVSHRGFFKEQSIVDYVEHVIRKNTRRDQNPDFAQFDHGLSDAVKDDLRNYLRQNSGLKIRYEDPQKKSIQWCKIKNLGTDSQRALFEITEGGNVSKISVYNYYKDLKGYKIRYPKLPVIEVGNKGRMLPMECCRIEANQPVGNRYEYTKDEQSEMIKNCKDRPFARKQKILNNIQAARYNQDPVLKEFGVTIGERGNTNRFLQVDAGMLLSPEIVYKDGYSAVRNGVWEMKKFQETVHIPNWILVNMDRSTYTGTIVKLADLLVNNATTVGMSMAKPLSTLNCPCTDEAGLEKFFKEQKSRIRGLQLIVVILPGGNMTDIAYRRVKYVSEIKIGVLTQCVKPYTVSRVSWMTAKNLLLKINSKVTGMNHIMHYPGSNQAVFDGSTMFVGADVTHPRGGKGDASERSVCAVAGSYDRHGFKYKMLYSVQRSCEEMISDMGRLIQALLMFFHKNNGFYPKKMFYYRDGVSDGQFAEVLNTEMSAIKLACKRLNANIKVTFLVVQKRHHTRFFPPRDLGDKNGNVLAGTIVNSTITHPSEHDFYLVSHQSIQGTARPTKYHVLYDEIEESDDYVEALTYYLCYMFARCTRAVSYPAPTYYSHLAAARAERYVKVLKEKKSGDALDAELKAGVLGEGTIHSDMRDQNPMFFV